MSLELEYMLQTGRKKVGLLFCLVTIALTISLYGSLCMIQRAFLFVKNGIACCHMIQAEELFELLTR